MADSLFTFEDDLGAITAAAAVPGSTLLRCPVCRIVVYIQRPNDPRPLEEVSADVEATIRAHLTYDHRIRLRLYDRFGWKWPLRGPLQ